MSSAGLSAKAGVQTNHTKTTSKARRVITRILELDACRQLQRSRSSELVKRAEPATGDASATEARRQRSRRLAKQPAAQGVRRRTETRLIEHVEGLDAQLEIQAGPDGDLAPNRHVQLAHRETT